MAPKKKTDPTKVDLGAMGWKGLIIAFLGYITTNVSSLPQLWSENKAEMREINKRLAALEENQASIKQFNFRMSNVEDLSERNERRIRALLDGINTIQPAANK